MFDKVNNLVIILLFLTTRKDFLMNDNIKIIFIDWFKTLCSGLYITNAINLDKDSIKDLDSRLFKNDSCFFNAWMRGEINHLDMVEEIADEKFSKDFILEQIIIGCEAMFFDKEEFINLIKQIKAKGIKVVIATDNTDLFNICVIPRLNLKEIFDDIINSCDIGYLKCDLDNKGQQIFYKEYLKKHNLKYENCVMIDDTLKVIETCQNSGMRVHCISTPEEVTEVLKLYA